MADPATVADYIRQAAQERGIDPDVALRVFKQESGFNPAARNVNDKEESYGVAQLNVRGGLGVEARKLGIEPSDPSQWPRHVDFALDTVKKDGWRQWYGARDVGIGRWDGIGGQTGGSTTQAPSSPVPFAPAAGAPYATNRTQPDDLASVFTASAPSPTAPRQQVAAFPQMPEEDPANTGIFEPRTSQQTRARFRKS